jgi:magnesium transporter
MIYVSDVIGRPVVDAEGQRLGRVQDMIAVIRGSAAHPLITALAVKTPKSTLVVALPEVTGLGSPVVTLTRVAKDMPAYDPGTALWLARDVMDKEIVDTDDARVVRVNDIELTQVNGSFYLANVVIGGLALVRRLGLAALVQRLAAAVGRSAMMGTISWEHVKLLSGTVPIRLRLFGGKATDLPAADMADIISDLNRVESGKVMESLDVEHLADTLEEVEPDFQATLVESLSDEKVADVLEEMAPDEAADLLAELPQERSEDLLGLMQKDEAEDVRKLLAYPEDSAGGLMTTDVVTVPPSLTAEQTIALLRETAQEAETIYYLYVADGGSHLLGVLSLQRLVLATPQTPITAIMHDRVVSVNPDTSQDEVAQLVSKYNLLAVPVVDDQNRLLGIVTADDAIDKMIPTAWKKRLPRLYS